MKAMELPEFDIDSLTLVERDQPEPGPSQVLVKFAASSLNYRDFLIAKGFYNAKAPLPIVPLSDGAGEVAAVGDGVTRAAVGDLVTPLFFPNWISGSPSFEARAQSGGCDVPGTLREYGVYDENAMAKAASNLNAEEAACFPCAGLTAWHSLVTASGTKAGDTVLVIGTGGVALFALQFAKAMGAKVVVVSSSDDKIARAKDLGADYAINYKTTPEWGKAAFELTGGCNTVVEIGGAGTLSQSLAALAIGGHIPILGQLSGMQTEFNILPILGKNANIHGVTVGNRDEYEDMMAFVGEHNIKPVIDKSFAFADAAAALNALPTGQHFGKITITI